MMKKIWIIFLLIISVIGTILAMPGVQPNSSEVAKNGIYSIQQFPIKQAMKLDGKWEFYWQKLYTPNDFKYHLVHKKPQIVNIPNGSYGFTLGKGKVSNTGYGTYRLQIKFPKKEVGTIKALYLPSISSAYTLWIDGKIQASNGTVGTSKNSMKPKKGEKVVQFEVSSTKVELVIQNSNYDQRKAGIFESILIGEPNVLLDYQEDNLIFRSIIIASLIMIGLYHFALFAFRRNELSLIFFGSLCLMIAIRTIFLQDSLALYLFPFINWELGVKLEYLGASLGCLFLYLFTYTLYSDDMSTKIRKLIIFVMSMYSLFIMIVPVMIFTKAMLLMQMMIFVVFLYLLYIYVKVFIKQRTGSVLNAVGLLILFICYVNDLLKFNGVINSIELTSISLVFYLFIQSIILSKSYSMSVQRSDQLTKDLSNLNALLEKKVQNRMDKINQSNQMLQTANQQLYEANLSKSKLVSNISHEIGSPLTIIRSYTRGMIDGVIDNDPKYIEIIHEKSISLTKILEDLVSLSDLDIQEFKFDLEKVDIHSFCQKVFHNHKLMIEKLGIIFEYKNSLSQNSHPIVLIDAVRIEQVIVNLLNNAQRFVRDNGKITLELDQQDEYDVLIKVRDNGVGIQEEDIDYVFDRFYSKKNQGKQHHGAGLGLAISKEIVEHHHGKIGVESKWGEGTCFYFTLPILKEENS